MSVIQARLRVDTCIPSYIDRDILTQLLELDPGLELNYPRLFITKVRRIKLSSQKAYVFELEGFNATKLIRYESDLYDADRIESNEQK